MTRIGQERQEGETEYLVSLETLVVAKSMTDAMEIVQAEIPGHLGYIVVDAEPSDE